MDKGFSVLNEIYGLFQINIPLLYANVKFVQQNILGMQMLYF